jgi:glycosyltransferase involved in cell wall biosynthesis
MSYHERDRPNAEVSFPSKLADCTAVGLSLIIDGPEYCSAVRWARENPGVAEVISDESVDALGEAIARLLQDSEHRLRLAKRAICVGQQYFEFSRAVSTLYSKLSVSRPRAESLHYDAGDLSPARSRRQGGYEAGQSGEYAHDVPLNRDKLPNLLYVGDVLVQAEMHGSTLMYRLLEDYPKEKLRIIEVLGASSPDRRLAGSEYRALGTRLTRLLWNRFHYYLSPIATLGAPILRHRIPKILAGFRPEALMTVVDGYSWATAAAYAEQHKLPLHLVLHDEHARVAERFAVERQWIERRLRHWYPRAASRLCVSPYMEETYRDRYGAVGDVLYPSRGKDSLYFTEPAPSLQGPCAPFTIAFGGSIHAEYARSLQRIAVALQSSRGRLIVYGPYTTTAVDRLHGPNVEWRGRVSSEEFITHCRNEAHAMYIPMSYSEKDRLNMEISFPSKLADSTAVGLPLIIDGPEYCSAVRWARQNPGVAEVVAVQDVDFLTAAISRLQDRAYRYRLAAEAISRGMQYFARDGAVKLLYAKLNASRFPDNCPRLMRGN